MRAVVIIVDEHNQDKENHPLQVAVNIPTLRNFWAATVTNIKESSSL